MFLILVVFQFVLLVGSIDYYYRITGMKTPGMMVVVMVIVEEEDVDDKSKTRPVKKQQTNRTGSELVAFIHLLDPAPAIQFSRQTFFFTFLHLFNFITKHRKKINAFHSFPFIVSFCLRCSPLANSLSTHTHTIFSFSGSIPVLANFVIEY